MSRTYRKIPHWASEVCLQDNWHGMKNGVSPINGNVIGFEDDITRGRAARLHTNKIRRAIDRKEITEGISEMINGAQEAMAELEFLDENHNLDEMQVDYYYDHDYDDYYDIPDPVDDEQFEDDYDPYWYDYDDY